MAIYNDRFRLRQDNKIVGFKKQIHSLTFYSKDEYAWAGLPIEYNNHDRFTGFFDNNRRAIYAEDIIELTKKEENKYLHIVWDEILENFQLYDLVEKEIIDFPWKDYLRNNPFVFKSYHFIQPQL